MTQDGSRVYLSRLLSHSRCLRPDPHHEQQPLHHLVIDGYQRIAALQQLGRDTVEAVLWPMSEAEALLLDGSLRWTEQQSALEQGWFLSETEQHFGYGLEELTRRFDHPPE